MSHNCHATNASKGGPGAPHEHRPSLAFKRQVLARWRGSGAANDQRGERLPHTAPLNPPLEHTQQNHMLWLQQTRDTSRTTCPPPGCQIREQKHVAALLAGHEGRRHRRRAPVDIYGGVKDPESPEDPEAVGDQLQLLEAHLL